MPPTLRNGITAIAIPMIPRPPIQCSIDLQSKMSGAVLSNPTSTVAPVVVSPDTVSNTASVKETSNSQNQKGNAPKKGTTSHAEAVMTNI